MEKETRITSIQISERLWIQLNGMKGLGETFEDVIVRMIKPVRSKKK